MEGKKHVAIISDAASTGRFSLVNLGMKGEMGNINQFS